MTDFYEGKWKPATMKPQEDQNVLISWKTQDGYWQGPYTAYYDEDEHKFFVFDMKNNIPVYPEIWIEIPEFPE